MGARSSRWLPGTRPMGCISTLAMRLACSSRSAQVRLGLADAAALAAQALTIARRDPLIEQLGRAAQLCADLQRGRVNSNSGC